MIIKKILTALYIVALFATTPSAGAVDIPNGSFKATLKALELKKGICVILGQSEVVTSEYIMNLASNSELIFYFQSEEEDEVRAVRELADAAGLLGSRVFVDSGSAKEIHITENLADIVIATKEYEKSEVLRILNPSGKGFIAGAKIVKPTPKGYASWDHPRHGGDNNLFSEDTTIKAPYQTQFVATPRYAPGLQVTVSSNGRIFKAFGSHAVHRRDEKYINKLMCFNAYNGTTLWEQDLPKGYAVHRNTMVATKDFLYLGTENSCDILDASTGKLVKKLKTSNEGTEKQACKWLAMEDGVLYLLLGGIDRRDNVLRRRSEEHGHVKGWTPFYQGHPGEWGHGNTLLAIDTETTKTVWSHKEQKGIDGRAVAIKNNHIYISRFGEYVACLNAKDGTLSWRKDKNNAEKTFALFGKKEKSKGHITRWDTNIYLIATDEVLLFSGSTFFTETIALSTKDGSLLWSYNGYAAKMISRNNELYLFPPAKGKTKSNALKLDLLSGEILKKLEFRNDSCVVTTGTSDSFFARTKWGSTMRYDIPSGQREFFTPMRPSCSEGVHASDGHLYWWPMFCDCTGLLYGIISLAPKSLKDDFTGNCKLTQTSEINSIKETHKADALDWATFRKDNKRTARTDVAVPEKAKKVWEYQMKGNAIPTAPIIVGNTVFLGANNGIVYALDSKTGTAKWKAYTGGPIMYPPSFWEGRVFVGSSDGLVYCFRASDGILLWKSLLAPNQNRISVYGKFQSIWPVASGVLVEKGIAYAAAGMTDYDGTFVYAFDAKTGDVKWKNLKSGAIMKNAGVSVMGHLLSNKNKLYLPGGMVVSPAVYDMSTGEFEHKTKVDFDKKFQGKVSSELYLEGDDNVKVLGPRLYSDPNSASLSQKVRRRFQFTAGDKKYIWLDDYMLICFPKGTELEKNRKLVFLKKKQVIDITSEIYEKKIWNYRFHNGGYDEGGYGPGRSPCGSRHGKALVISKNALILTEEDEKKEGEVYSSSFGIIALNPNNGELFWRSELSHRPVSWGLAVGRNGNTIISLRNGKIVCFGEE